VVSVERRFMVEFGPSRSKRFGLAVAEARRGADECGEREPGRYWATFRLGEDAAAYAALAALLGRVRHWRASEVSEGDEPVSAYHAKEMGWCPLFEAERAIRDVLGENPPPATVFEITLGPNLRALRRGELPDRGEDAEPAWEVPDFPPEGWRARPGGEEPPS
jgi:hypothetical protein